MNKLPIEIIESIFNIIENPLELLPLRSVCKIWRDIIDNDLEQTHKLRMWCEKKMSPICIQQILGASYPKIEQKTDKLPFYDTITSDVWKGVCESFIKTQWVVDKIPKIQIYEVDASPIISSDISGKFII